ncbi:hypothetical protein HY573_02450 [Candidatus Parcubacteria bacterium]|nr:hypothetical protein [Candidatus Parcubacteria bacterium]
MRYRRVSAVMQLLRQRSRLVRSNNLKVNEWVDGYLNQCLANGEQVTILTQWCASKDLEARFVEQGGKFVYTRKERLLFEKEIPAIARLFQTNGLRLSWWVTFNRSYRDSGRIDRALEAEYRAMISVLAQPLMQDGWLMVVDWEDEVLGKRPGPNPEVLARMEEFVGPSAFDLEFRRHAAWVRDEARLSQSDTELRRDVSFQIACEAEEGRLLGGIDSPFGEFILIPLEAPERYDFFTLLVPDFKKRIVAALSSYPWRLGERS